MSNKTLFLISALVFLGVTISLLQTALEHQLWREFIVSEFALTVTTFCSIVLLRKK